jgi:hypothetical protein
MHSHTLLLEGQDLEGDKQSRCNERETKQKPENEH